MKTSKEWWAEVKNSPELLTNWLKRQYHGEVTASIRITEFCMNYATDLENKKKLYSIALQENQHAEWIGELLKNRGIKPLLLNKEERYWNQTLPGITDFKTGAAVAAHAEKMRLERIRIISEDPDAPEDIRNAFQKILLQEIWHEEIFREMAGEKAWSATLGQHNKGLEALGLIV